MNATIRQAPLISVILPVYNAERYVGEAIESILRQTLADFELIVIDDGSTDSSHDVIQRYARQDRRIRVVSRENRGLVLTLNEGIEMARGQWIARMDADDIALPHRLEKQMAYLMESRADLCGGAVQCFGGSTAVWRYPLSHDACEVWLLFDVPFAHPAVTGRRKVFATCKYDPKFKTAQDYDLWQRAWARGFRMGNIPDVVLRYRAHDGQVSSVSKAMQNDLAREIRLRHWQAVSGNLQSKQFVNIELALHDDRASLADLQPLFVQLISRYSGEAAFALRTGLFRVFCKQAAYQKDVAALWDELYARSAKHPKLLLEKSVFLALSRLKVKSGSRFFKFLKALYLKASLR